MEDWIELARAACRQAYAPYSQFTVGAVAVGADGGHAVGCNVENASYGLTCCAERNALFQLIAQGERSLTLVVLYTPTPTPTSPCGACRQVLFEFGPTARVVAACEGPERIDTTVAELLPGAFGPRDLR